ncbi:MAG: DUF2326 domain-containing protein [bacterium]|nr:DUF2326 domain-containing protein [bacterium]
MFLKKLSVSNDDMVIRDILFHKGVNLIIDETKTSDLKQTGNNVGKTTVLRLIDYCFGGSGDNIYKDPEFKAKTNTQVEGFLNNNNIIISMTLKQDLEIASSREIIVRRNFLQRSEKILEINGEQYTEKEFVQTLKELIFDSKHDKPKLRQIIAKNIRDERNRLTNALMVLHPCTKIEEYEALFLFWLGIEVDVNEQKQKLLREHSMETRLLSRLKRETSFSQIEQSLIIINRSIAELNVLKDSFDINDNYSAELDKLNEVKLRVNELATSVSNLELRKELISESKSELEREISSADSQRVSILYKEAKSLIPTIQKSFEDTIIFHNAMLQKKMGYITKDLPDIEESLASMKRELTELLTTEKRLAESLQKSGVIDKLQKVVTELNEAYERKGALEEQKRVWELSAAKLATIEQNLKKINDSIDAKDALIQERITEFNKYFSEMTAKLYGERFVLSSSKHEKGYLLDIGSVSGNLGTGKKKGQIAAFDLAYIQFADAQGIECLHFILQDQIENIHDNQINSLFTEIVSGVNCQYVLPILRDKLPPNIDVSQYEVLSLSQSDKLFRIP